MVDILPKFVREERFGNWALHIDAVSEMLRYLAASGHNPYTKSAYLCVHRMSKLKDERQDVYHDRFRRRVISFQKKGAWWEGEAYDEVY